MNRSSNTNPSTAVDSALSLCDILKEAGPKHKDFHMTNNSSINCVSKLLETPNIKQTMHETCATKDQCSKEPMHCSSVESSSVESESFTIPLNDLDSPAVQTQNQRLFAEKRKKKAERHTLSYSAVIQIALSELSDDEEE